MSLKRNKNNTNEKLCYRPQGVADVLDIGITMARDLIMRGEIKSTKIGRCRVVTRAELETFVRRLATEGQRK